MAIVDAPRVAARLGGRSVLRRQVRSVTDLEALVREGLPWRALRAFLAGTARGAQDQTWLADIVAPRTTRIRRERDGRLSPEESERLERLARLTALAAMVLESEAEAQDFLFHPHPLLGGERPAALARSELGARQVEELLWRLEYSLPV
jgi:putative toxin-antitoxin system antitoxin component (TIGR02293 family)